MTTPPRTPQQRDRRFARVRHVTRGVLVGSGLSSAALVGLFASTAKPVVHLIEPATTTTTVPATTTTTPTTPTTTTTTPSSTTVPAKSGGTTPTTSAPSTTTTSPPTTTTTVPATTTTQPTCYTSPSGIQECN